MHAHFERSCNNFKIENTKIKFGKSEKKLKTPNFMCEFQFYISF